jgi:hypothetical protein
VSLRGEDGVVREKKWAAGAPDPGIARTVPWRTFRWRHGQQHYSGTYWSSVMSAHVIYESRLELTRLLYADFDRATEAVLAQPFLLSARVDGGKRRHVPDFLILRRGRVPLVADVKPRHLLTRPKVAFSLGWAREAVESRGWEFEAWSEPPEAELANVRFLAGYRRPWLFDPELVAEIRGADLDGATLGEAFRAFPRRPAELARAGVLHLLWAQHLVTDLATPLSARHRLRTGVPAEVTGASGTARPSRQLPTSRAEGRARSPLSHNMRPCRRGHQDLPGGAERGRLADVPLSRQTCAGRDQPGQPQPTRLHRVRSEQDRSVLARAQTACADRFPAVRFSFCRGSAGSLQCPVAPLRDP